MVRRCHEQRGWLLGGMVFHVLNRGVARMQLFEKAADYQAFEQVLRDTLDQSPMRICAYAVMPNHWHLRGVGDGHGGLPARYRTDAGSRHQREGPSPAADRGPQQPHPAGQGAAQSYPLGHGLRPEPVPAFRGTGLPSPPGPAGRPDLAGRPHRYLLGTGGQQPTWSATGGMGRVLISFFAAGTPGFIPYAAMSETSSNCWKTITPARKIGVGRTD